MDRSTRNLTNNLNGEKTRSLVPETALNSKQYELHESKNYEREINFPKETIANLKFNEH